MFKEYTIDSFDENYDIIGSYSAHLNISKKSDVVTNYFIEKHRLKKEELDKLLESIKDDNISILMNMEVELDFRGEGYGSELLENFLEESNSPAILICDSSETDFLQQWYADYNFEVVGNISGFPIMVKYE